MSLGGFLWRYFRRYLGWAALAGVAILVFAAATLVLVALLVPIFGEVLMTEAPAGLAAVTSSAPADAPKVEPVVIPGVDPGWLERTRSTLRQRAATAFEDLKTWLGVGPEDVATFIPILFVVVFLIRSLADFTSGFAFQRLGLGATTDIRNDLYRRILDQSSRFFAEHQSGELVSRVVNDIALVQNAVSSRLLDLFQQSVTLLFLVGMLVLSSPRVAFFTLIVAPLLLYPIVRFGKGMRRTSRRSQERMAELAALLNEGVRGHRVVKAFGMEEFEHRRFRDATGRHLRVTLRGELLSNMSSPVIESVAVIAAGALLIWAGRAVRADETNAAALAALLGNLIAMYDPIRKLNKVNLILQQSLAATQRVRDLMEVPVEVTDRPGAVVLERFEREIRYQAVEFGYRDQPVLQGVDLVVEKGETVALVGRNGSGKSTIVSLLPRFYDPDAGSVMIDGRDVRDLTLDSLRRNIAIVTQETLLFADTVRANIAYGRSDIPIELVQEAARAAYAEDFVLALPQGYDTVLGEGGSGLSGGQRQRLAIARALLRDAPILILDEATSALDPESEALFQRALSNLMRGRTTLVIAHRLSTIRNAARIAVIDAGRVVESGRHEELLANGGLYRQLHDLQFEV